ncbi:MAG: protein-glutamate O-methyltransferase CheR [Clostridium sp.]|nr:protein-glutamate O-methyltransferase CheR [Clostridium sp.]MCM1400166.1 protein-glutamate O-methyltransferase CheR [Clostridium sp.]MCM1460898.1 protein-glutamate O-methyltransferase CheR [Bacteroides sp.]
MAYGYEQFKKDVYRLTNINLDMYKERQMKRRIESLIDRKGFKGFDDFYKGMEQDKALLRTFVSYLTINVSQFYRNPGQWETFEKEMIPYLRKCYGDKITIWSAACSTGDEPYTLAMIMSKYLPTSKIKIIATDIDEDVIAFAKEGIYTEKSLVDLPEEYKKRHFKKVDNYHSQISDEIKACVTFKKHNLLEDAYLKDVSMIVCRNVVIYFTEDAKDEVYRKFYKSLSKDGLLFIGNTEQILRAKEMGFQAIKTFFYKKM